MLLVDRRIFTHMDWRLLFLIGAILVVGISTIYSVTPQWSRGGTPLYLKQSAWAAVGLAAFSLFAVLDYQRLLRYAHHIFWVALGLLLLVEFLGHVGMGAQRWVQVAGVNVQPSELTKLAVILILARHFSAFVPEQGFHFRELGIPLIYLALPFVLILRQPDLGSALLVVFVFAMILFVVGLHARSLMLAGLLAGMSFPFLWEFLWNSLREYQRNRLLTFLNPGSDPLGTGYHVIQSKIAIGAGGLAGQGFLQGSQSQLMFLPEGHTDFIFSVFAEQWGFLGVTVLFLLFAGLIVRGMDIAMKARDIAGTVLAVGVVGMIIFPTIVNLGMTLGVAPVVGVPLPLMSYGGTSLVTTMAALGILANVNLQRHLSLYR